MGLKEEQELKAKYLLATEEFEGIQIVKLTTDNVARVEAMIMTDSGYAKSSDINSGPTYNRNGEEDYPGSTAYWMTKLRYELENKHSDNLRDIISHAVISVDIENSTHINSDGVGRNQLTDRIMNKIHCLKDILSDIEKGISFIEELAALTTVFDNKHKARTNLSFASKFVHYACFYLFVDDRRDNFSIYDKVLNKALPIYIKKYNLNNYDPKSYRSYYYCIEKIIESCGESLSRNGFDHLVWYYYKARLDSLKNIEIQKKKKHKKRKNEYMQF